MVVCTGHIAPIDNRQLHTQGCTISCHFRILMSAGLKTISHVPFLHIFSNDQGVSFYAFTKSEDFASPENSPGKLLGCLTVLILLNSLFVSQVNFQTVGLLLYYSVWKQGVMKLLYCAQEYLQTSHLNAYPSSSSYTSWVEPDFRCAFW